MLFEIVLFHHCFGLAGSGSAVADAIWQLWCWIICNANPVAVFSSHIKKVRTRTRTHTHTLIRAVSAAESHGEIHHALRPPEAS